MNIIVFCNAFPRIDIGDVDMSTFSYHGSTEGYPYGDSKTFNFIGFVAENAHEVVEKIKATFQLNPERCKSEDYIWVKTKFESYETDKRPRIGIKFESGMAGMRNPPSFSFKP